MKILFQNRKKDLWIGGDYIQMEKTAEALRRLGVEVDISEASVVAPEIIERYDIVHLWNFSMPWTKYQLWVARKHKKSVVCSMIYHESPDLIPYNLQQVMLNETSKAIFLTKGELQRVKRHLDIKDEQIAFVDNGIDPFWLEVSKSRILMEDFVLTVGRLDGTKGQLQTAQACKELNLPYVMIGERNNEEYTRKCEAFGALWKPKMSHFDLKPWYYSAKVFMLASKAEVQPLTIMEALSQGTQCVLTKDCEWEIPIMRCDPNDVESIKNAINKSWKEKDFTLGKKLKTWDEIAVKIKKIYESISTNTKQ